MLWWPGITRVYTSQKIPQTPALPAFSPPPPDEAEPCGHATDSEHAHGRRLRDGGNREGDGVPGRMLDLSGARSSGTEPSILMGDEPTGNLDSRTGADVIALLRKLNVDRSLTVVLVTHDQQVARHADRTIVLRDGLIVADTTELKSGKYQFPKLRESTLLSSLSRNAFPDDPGSCTEATPLKVSHDIGPIPETRARRADRRGGKVLCVCRRPSGRREQQGERDRDREPEAVPRASCGNSATETRGRETCRQRRSPGEEGSECGAGHERFSNGAGGRLRTCGDNAVAADPAGRNTLNFEQRLKALPPDLRPLPADVPDELPVIPGYDNLQLHASGGMATIYRARDAELGREVAIKLLSSHAIHSRTGRQRALREARLLARLAHPGVVTIHATGVWQERPYLVLEWIDGCTLQEKIDAGSLRPERAAEIARDLAQTLIGLHDAGIVHRDLKPDNVLLADPVAAGLPETVKLIDFGLARPDDASRELTIGDTVLGTPSYMAAEQTGLDPDLGETNPATDVHGIGCLLFAMLTGQAPYKAASVMASLQRAVRGEVPAGSNSTTRRRHCGQSHRGA